MSDAKDFLARLLGEASGGRVKVIEGNDLAGLLQAIGVKHDCGDEECPLRSEEPEHPGIITPEKLQGLDARAALDLAVAAGSSANNASHRSDHQLSAERRKLAEMWMDVYDALLAQEAADGLNPHKAQAEEALRAYQQLTEANKQLRAEVNDLKSKLEIAEEHADSLASQLADATSKG